MESKFGIRMERYIGMEIYRLGFGEMGDKFGIRMEKGIGTGIYRLRFGEMERKFGIRMERNIETEIYLLRFGKMGISLIYGWKICEINFFLQSHRDSAAQGLEEFEYYSWYNVS
jgi:hypothetical protein